MKSNNPNADLLAGHLENIFQSNEATIEWDLVQNQTEGDDQIKLATPQEIADKIRTNITCM